MKKFRMYGLVLAIMSYFVAGCSVGPQWRSVSYVSPSEKISYQDNSISLLRPYEGIADVAKASAIIRDSISREKLNEAIVANIKRRYEKANPTDNSVSGCSYLGIIVNERRKSARIFNPENSLPPQLADPWAYVILCVNQIPDLVPVILDERGIISSVAVFRNKKEFNGIQTDFGARLRE
jgi:hypothetical protein